MEGTVHITGMYGIKYMDPLFKLVNDISLAILHRFYFVANYIRLFIARQHAILVREGKQKDLPVTFILIS